VREHQQNVSAVNPLNVQMEDQIRTEPAKINLGMKDLPEASRIDWRYAPRGATPFCKAFRGIRTISAEPLAATFQQPQSNRREG
jgi:hypothetical protein